MGWDVSAEITATFNKQICIYKIHKEKKAKKKTVLNNQTWKIIIRLPSCQVDLRALYPNSNKKRRKRDERKQIAIELENSCNNKSKAKLNFFPCQFTALSIQHTIKQRWLNSCMNEHNCYVTYSFYSKIVYIILCVHFALRLDNQKHRVF